MQHLDLMPLRFADQWAIDTNDTLRLPGAHGEEMVRSISINPEVRSSISQFFLILPCISIVVKKQYFPSEVLIGSQFRRRQFLPQERTA